MTMSNNKFYCFRCGQEGPPIKVDGNHILGLCSCHEGWFVGTVPQLIDLLNDAYFRLEDLGEEVSVLAEFRDTDVDDLYNYDEEMDE